MDRSKTRRVGRIRALAVLVALSVSVLASAIPADAAAVSSNNEQPQGWVWTNDSADARGWVWTDAPAKNRGWVWTDAPANNRGWVWTSGNAQPKGWVWT